MIKFVTFRGFDLNTKFVIKSNWVWYIDIIEFYRTSKTLNNSYIKNTINLNDKIY